MAEAEQLCQTDSSPSKTSSPQESPTLRRYKLIVAYNGTRFKGFQRQSSGSAPTATSTGSKKRSRGDATTPRKVPLTVQECIEDGLEQYSGLDRTQLRMRFSGRTDGGVHARGQVVAISLPISSNQDDDDDDDDDDALWKIHKSINSRLPDDISVQEVSVVTNPTFCPRTDAIRKRYSYTLKYRRKVWDANGKLLPICTSGPNCIRSGLDPNTLWICPWALDDSLMEHYCQRLTGHHDYSAFVHKRSRRDQPNLLTVERFAMDRLALVEEAAPVVTVQFQVEAKGFRRAMVRNLVGFVVDLCRGQVDLSSLLDTIIWTGTDEVAKSVHSAPPYGLCLEHVIYPTPDV